MEQSITVDTTNSNPQVAQPPSPLMTSLLAVLESHISDLVIQQVSRILTNHATLRVINEGFTEHIKEIATAVVEAAISDHNDEEYHISEDNIQDIATTAVEDHDFDNQIEQAVQDAINDFDFEDIVRTAIKDNITFSISVD